MVADHQMSNQALLAIGGKFRLDSNFALQTGKWQEWSTMQYEAGVGWSGVCNGRMEVWLW